MLCTEKGSQVLCIRIGSLFPEVTIFELGFKERIDVQKLEYLFLCGQEEGCWRVTVSCPGFCYWFLLFIPPSIHVGHAFQVPPVCDVCDENMG